MEGLNWTDSSKDGSYNRSSFFEQNQFESYTKLRMLYIFSVAPLILVGKWSVGKDLFELRNENFKLKFKQRLI